MREAEPRAWPKVAVILLNWNGWRDTTACLASLKQLTYPNSTVVVVDNASTNDSVSQIRHAFPEVVLLENAYNWGFARGNNVGIRYALEQQAEYVWLLNNDTVVGPESLASMVRLAESDAAIGAVGSVVYYANEPHRVQAWGGGRLSMFWGTALHVTKPLPDSGIDYLVGASLLIKGPALQQVGLLDEGLFMYWDDADYCLRLRQAGWKLAVAPASHIWHKESASVQGRSPMRDLYANASAVRFFYRHAPVPLLPLVLGTTMRVAKRLLAGQPGRAWAVLRGVSRGLLQRWGRGPSPRQS